MLEWCGAVRRKETFCSPFPPFRAHVCVSVCVCVCRPANPPSTSVKEKARERNNQKQQGESHPLFSIIKQRGKERGRKVITPKRWGRVCVSVFCCFFVWDLRVMGFLSSLFLFLWGGFFVKSGDGSGDERDAFLSETSRRILNDAMRPGVANKCF